MIHANSYSTSMAKALLTITKPELLVSPEKLSRSSPGSSAKLEVLQQESEALLTDLKQVEESYATQALDLTLGLGYVEHWLANPRVAKYLAKHHAELLNEFNKLLGEKSKEMSRTISNQTVRAVKSGTKRSATVA